MIDKKFSNLFNRSEKQPNKVFHSRALRQKAHQSLFKNCIKNERLRRQKIDARYFDNAQVQRLAKFLALPDIQQSSVDALLVCRSVDTHKAKLQKILASFINGETGSVSTVKDLERFVNEYKPLAWQLWRFFEYLRFQKLNLFIEDFKCHCLKEVLQEMDGYSEAPNVYEAEYGLVNRATKASNTAALKKSNDIITQKIRDKQQNSLFFRGQEKSLEHSVVYYVTNQKKAGKQSESLFKSFD